MPTGEVGVDYPTSERALGHSTLYRAKWREYTAIWEGRRDEYVESCKRDVVALARVLEWDFVPVFLVPSCVAPPSPPKFLGDYTWQEGDGRIMKFSPVSEGIPVCISYPPMSGGIPMNATTEIDPSELELVRHVVRELGDTHFILGRGPDGSFPYDRYGYMQLLTAMIDDPVLLHEVIEAETAKAIVVNEALLDAGCDAILPGDDYCGNQGPLMSPAHFREFIMPALTALCKSAKAKGRYCIKHTDGNTWPILDMMLEAGIDGLHGIQPSVGMDLSRLKARYGERLCFWGGIDVEVLIESTPEQVRRATRDAIDAAAQGGGLVLTSGNTIMVGVKYENYMAMLETVRAYDYRKQSMTSRR